MVALISLSVAMKDFNIISASFQNLFVVVLGEKEGSFYTNLFWFTEMR
jgi:hypothetical protein